MKKIILGMLICIPLLISCGPAKSKMTVARNQIPPEFSNFEGTLLIVSQYRTWDKFAKSAFKKNYKGEYKFIKDGEQNHDDYSNLEQYRYILAPNFYSAFNTGPDARFGTTHVSSEALIVLDRKTGKKYQTKSTAMFGKLLKRYAAALEDERSR